MISEHTKPNGKYHSHEYTAFTLNQCTSIHTICSLLSAIHLHVFDTVGKNSVWFYIGILNSTKCRVIVLSTNKILLMTRWGSFRDRLTVIDSTFELIPGLR